MLEPVQQRILCLDIRPRSFAFVVFEGPKLVLDWGARSFRRGVNAVRVPLGKKVARLLEEYVPCVLVLERPRTRKHVRIVAAIRKQAKLQRIPIRLLSAKVIDAAFSGSNDNKHQIASTLATRFPDLISVLPPKRRSWESEDYRMSMFDAAALGTAYFERKCPSDPVLPQPH
jgi:hypothetical protein